MGEGVAGGDGLDESDEVEEEEEVEVGFVLDSYGDNEPTLLPIPLAAISEEGDEHNIVDSLIQELPMESVVATIQAATKTPGKRGRPTKSSLAIDSIPPSDVTDTPITAFKAKRSRAVANKTSMATVAIEAATVTEEEEDQAAKDELALGTATPLPTSKRSKKVAKTPTTTTVPSTTVHVSKNTPVTVVVEEGEGDSVSGTESETESVKALKRSSRATKKPDKYLA